MTLHQELAQNLVSSDEPYINLGGGDVTVEAIEMFLLALKVKGNCKIINAGDVNIIRLTAELSGRRRY